MTTHIDGFEIFPNAPIKEAIFEIGIKDLPRNRIPELEALHESYKNHYPDIKPIQVFEKFFAFGEPAPTSEQPQDSSWTQGYQMWASNHQELHTCRLNGFSYNKLKPYLDGSNAIIKTIAGWDIFQKNIPNIEVDKLAVRNINVIDITETRFELDDYLMLSPKIPDTLSGHDMVGFFVNTVLNFPEHNASCSITLAPQPGTGSGLSILLDIEAKKSATNISTCDEIKAELECLKYIKDKVFFSIITDKARELFR